MNEQSPGKSVGAILREARESKGLTLEELHQRTRILPQYIRLLEQDHFDFFPEPYIRGFVRSICEELGLDPTPLLDQIHELLHPPELEEEAAGAEVEETAGVEGGKARRTGDFVIVGLIVVVLGALVYGYTQYRDRWFGPGKRTVEEIPLEQALAEQAAKPKKQTAQPAKPPQRSVLRLGIRTTDSCWVRVVADDSVEYEYLFGPGGRQRIEALEKLYIKTGNAGGLVLTLNDQEVGPLGRRGEVVELWISADGEVQMRGRGGRRVVTPTARDTGQ